MVHSFLSLFNCPGLDVEQGHGLAYGSADGLRDQVCCVTNMLGAEMRLTRALREQRKCYRTSMSVPSTVSSASRQGSLLLRWLFFTTDLKPDGLDVGRRRRRHFRQVNTEMAMRRRLIMSDGDNE
jgi:hypothetical protein